MSQFGIYIYIFLREAQQTTSHMFQRRDVQPGNVFNAHRGSPQGTRSPVDLPTPRETSQVSGLTLFPPRVTYVTQRQRELRARV